MATILSMSLGFRSRMGRASFRLNVRTCMRVNVSSQDGHGEQALEPTLKQGECSYSRLDLIYGRVLVLCNPTPL
jgi:hypothetical protein